MKLKSIAAAVALACGAMVAAQAQAAQVSSDNRAGGLATGNGVGGLFLSVFDSIGNQTLFMDLGKTTNDFFAGMNGYSKSNAILQNFLASVNSAGNSAGVEWNVGAIMNGNETPGKPFGVLATYLPGVTIDDSLNTSTGLFSGTLYTATYIDTNNANLLSTTLTTDGTAVFGGKTDLGNGYYTPNYYHNFGGGIAFNDAGHLGDSLFTSFIQLTSDFSGTVHTSYEQGAWNLNAATGTLTYSAVSAVPVPAAVWLFGSALVGLTGISRRRKAV